MGDVLGSSPEALYLREPITQTHLRHSPEGSPSFFHIEDGDPPPAYVAAADAAFAGLPRFSESIVRRPVQWSITRRLRRRVVIKEVNPLALTWLLGRYRLRIVYVVRHPAAFATSSGSHSSSGALWSRSMSRR